MTHSGVCVTCFSEANFFYCVCLSESYCPALLKLSSINYRVRVIARRNSIKHSTLVLLCSPVAVQVSLQERFMLYANDLQII